MAGAAGISVIGLECYMQARAIPKPWIYSRRSSLTFPHLVSLSLHSIIHYTVNSVRCSMAVLHSSYKGLRLDKL